MTTLIVYATKHGSTEKCAKILSEGLGGEVELRNLKKEDSADLSQYTKVIIGGSIHMGKIQKEVSDFALKNLDLLRKKEVGLFICCMREGDIAYKELTDSFPEELLNNAVAKDYFGGEFIFGNMSPMDKLIVKKVVKIDKDMSNILEDKIKRFVQAMNNA